MVELKPEMKEPVPKVRLTIDGMMRWTYNEAKGEEWAAFDDTARHVATVVALADDALVALDFGPEGVLAADEEEEDHGCRCFQRCTILCKFSLMKRSR